MKVIVASTNPVKINATKIAFEKMFGINDFEFEGVDIKSGVSDQPKSEEETFKGATNRANNASKNFPEADYWVGIEGGIKENDLGMITFGYVVVKDRKGKLGYGKSMEIVLPNKIAELVRGGLELGHASDKVFNENNIKQKEGTVGVLTKGNITRTDAFVNGIIMSLVPFVNPELY